MLLVLVGGCAALTELSEQRRPPLAVTRAVALVSLLVGGARLGQLGLSVRAATRARANARLVHGHGAQREATSAARDERHDPSVLQALHRLAVDVRDEIERRQAGLERRAALLHRLQANTTTRLVYRNKRSQNFGTKTVACRTRQNHTL